MAVLQNRASLYWNIVQADHFVFRDRHELGTVMVVSHTPHLVSVVVESVHALFVGTVPDLDSVVS